ncbi:hypothetical protein D3C76_1043910 [compost metagenome]
MLRRQSSYLSSLPFLFKSLNASPSTVNRATPDCVEYPKVSPPGLVTVPIVPTTLWLHFVLLPPLFEPDPDPPPPVAGLLVGLAAVSLPSLVIVPWPTSLPSMITPEVCTTILVTFFPPVMVVPSAPGRIVIVPTFAPSLITITVGTKISIDWIAVDPSATTRTFPPCLLMVTPDKVLLFK